MEIGHSIPMCEQLLPNGAGEGNRSILFSFAVVDGQDAMVEIRVSHAKLEAFEQTEPATVEELDHQIVGVIQLTDDPANLRTGRHDGDVRFSFGADGDRISPGSFSLSKHCSKAFHIRDGMSAIIHESFEGMGMAKSLDFGYRDVRKTGELLKCACCPASHSMEIFKNQR